MSLEAAIAVHPLRLGRPSGEIEAVGPDPKAWLTAQIGMPAEQPVAPDGSTVDFNAVKVADEGMGPLVGPATKTAMARAETQEDALALLMSSPEFQRR